MGGGGQDLGRLRINVYIVVRGIFKKKIVKIPQKKVANFLGQSYFPCAKIAIFVGFNAFFFFVFFYFFNTSRLYIIQYTYVYDTSLVFLKV